MPKISIIIPVYNVAPYLRQCLDSVINQTFKDIEIICIDDCSTDGSLAILKDYAALDNRITIIEQKSNQGVGVVRNIGEKNATADYILFLDSDDYIAQDLCEKLLNKFAANDVDAVYFNSAFFQDGCDNFLTNRDRLKDISQKIPPTEIFRASQYYESVTKLTNPVWYKCYKKDFLLKHNIFCSEVRCCEDSFFTVNFLLADPKLSYINEFLHFYRIRANSLSKNIDKKVDIFFNEYEKCMNSILSSELSLQNKLFFIKARVRWLRYWTHNKIKSKKCRQLNQIRRKKYFEQILSLFSFSDIQKAKFDERFWEDLYAIGKFGLSFYKDYSSGYLRYRVKFLIFKFSYTPKERK